MAVVASTQEHVQIANLVDAEHTWPVAKRSLMELAQFAPATLGS